MTSSDIMSVQFPVASEVQVDWACCCVLFAGLMVKTCCHSQN